MHVIFAASCRTIPELLRDELNGGHGVSLCLGGRPRRPQGFEDEQRQARPGPGTKVLGCKVLLRNFAQVLVNVFGIDLGGLSGIIEIFKQLVAGKVLASLDNACELVIFQLDVVDLPALATEVKPQRSSRYLRVPVAEGRKPKRIVFLGVLLVADPNGRRVQQTHDSGQHSVAG